MAVDTEGLPETSVTNDVTASRIDPVGSTNCKEPDRRV